MVPPPVHVSVPRSTFSVPAVSSVPESLSTALTLAVVVLGSLLIAALVVTVGYSVRAARERRRRTPARAALRSGLLDRLYEGDDPAWDEWVSGLSALERDELESLLDVYLRQLDGVDADELAALGTALGIDERARPEIAEGDYWDRIHALVWLALLRDPPDRDLLRERCTDTPRERAAAETLVGQCGPDAASAREWTAASVREGAGSSDGEAGASFDAAWAWATEHARFDRLARDISRDRDRLREEVRG